MYRLLDTMVISGDDVCCGVVFDTLVGVFVLSVMWSELLMTIRRHDIEFCSKCLNFFEYPRN